MGCTNKDIEFFYRELLSNRVPLVAHQIDEENILNVNELRYAQCMNTGRREKRKSTQSSQDCIKKRHKSDDSDVILRDAFNRDNIVANIDAFKRGNVVEVDAFERDNIGVESDAFNRNNDFRADEYDLRHFAKSVKEAIKKRREENHVVHVISLEMEIDESI